MTTKGGDQSADVGAITPPYLTDNEGTDIKCLTKFPLEANQGTSALATDAPYPAGGEGLSLIAELNRVKCLFQLRAISTVMGIQSVRQALDDSAAQLSDRADRSAPLSTFHHDHTASAGSATQS